MKIVSKVLSEVRGGDYGNVVPFLEFVASNGDIAESIDEAYLAEECMDSWEEDPNTDGRNLNQEGENKMIKLAKLKRGQVFNLGGYEWLVVEHDEAKGSALVTTTECISEMAFHENNSNDFRNSSLRKYLNSDFLEELLDGGLEIDDVMYTDFDLTGHQGGDYGICRDLIGLLTEDQYKEHKDILVIDDWWWLITPGSGNSSNVRSVITAGSLGSTTAYDGYIGVRPALTLDSETEVSAEQGHKGLEDYSSEELLQELLRRERC